MDCRISHAYPAKYRSDTEEESSDLYRVAESNITFVVAQFTSVALCVASMALTWKPASGLLAGCTTLPTFPLDTVAATDSTVTTGSRTRTTDWPGVCRPGVTRPAHASRGPEGAPGKTWERPFRATRWMEKGVRRGTLEPRTVVECFTLMLARRLAVVSDWVPLLSRTPPSPSPPSLEGEPSSAETKSIRRACSDRRLDSYRRQGVRSSRGRAVVRRH